MPYDPLCHVRSRRDFLKRTAAGGTGLAVVPGLALVPGPAAAEELAARPALAEATGAPAAGRAARERLLAAGP